MMGAANIETGWCTAADAIEPMKVSRPGDRHALGAKRLRLGFVTGVILAHHLTHGAMRWLARVSRCV
jgi:hypothetical protein